MSWIAEYDTQGREFPTCVHVTKTTGGMIRGATYVPIEDGEAARAENAKLRKELADAPKCDACEAMLDCDECLRADGSHKERRRLSSENAKLTKLARWMYQVMDESCAVHHPYEPAPVSIQALMRAEKELRALGIEVAE